MSVQWRSTLAWVRHATLLLLRTACGPRVTLCARVVLAAWSSGILCGEETLGCSMLAWCLWGATHGVECTRGGSTTVVCSIAF